MDQIDWLTDEYATSGELGRTRRQNPDLDDRQRINDAVLEVMEQARKKGLIERTTDSLKDQGMELQGRSGPGGVKAMRQAGGDVVDWLRGYPARAAQGYKTMGQMAGEGMDYLARQAGIPIDRGHAELDAGLNAPATSSTAPVPPSNPRATQASATSRAAPPGPAMQPVNAALRGNAPAASQAQLSQAPAVAQGQPDMVALVRQVLDQGRASAPQQRPSGGSILDHPDLSAALLSAGIELMMGSGQGRGWGEALGRAAGSGMGSVQASRRERAAQADKQYERDMARNRLILEAMMSDRADRRQAATRAEDRADRRSAEAGRNRRHLETIRNRTMNTLLKDQDEFSEEKKTPDQVLGELDALLGGGSGKRKGMSETRKPVRKAEKDGRVYHDYGDGKWVDVTDDS